jgi:hypothetical protein
MPRARKPKECAQCAASHAHARRADRWRAHLENQKSWLLAALNLTCQDTDLVREIVLTQRRNEELTKQNQWQQTRILQLMAERDTLNADRNRLHRALMTEQMKATMAGMRKMTAEPTPAIPADVWRRLAHLCHPDKHNGSEAANHAMQWLNAHR